MEALQTNKTLEEIHVGNLMVGCTVRLKSGEEKVVTDPDFYDGIKVQVSEDKVKPSEFEWDSQVPAFCAGIEASPSLISVSTIFRLH